MRRRPARPPATSARGAATRADGGGAGAASTRVAGNPEQSFELASHGVQVYLRKPVTLPIVEAAIERAAAMPSLLDQQLRQQVGRKPLHDVEAAVRETMVDEALARSGGGRRAAARLLRVSRQLLQHILRRKDDAAD